MGFEIWNKNAKEGKIAIAQEETKRIVSGHERDMKNQEIKADVEKHIANLLSGVVNCFINKHK